MELRPYQREAVEAVERSLENVRSALLVLPTGAGKTIVFSTVASDAVKKGKTVLILAHRGELLSQARDKLRAATGIEAGIEKAEFTSESSGDEPPYMVVVGSVQSMCREKRLSRFRKDDFSLIIIDECHHALTGTYRSILDYFSGAKVLGVTATPDRGDQRGLCEVFDEIAYEYKLVQAVKDGYLCPIMAQTIPLKLDMTGCVKQGGDYQVASVGSALDPYLMEICREVISRTRDRKTVIFTPLIATSQKMLEFFRELGCQSVDEVNGQSDNRSDILQWFDKAPKGSILLNSMLLTEGWDCTSVDCIVILRATKVRGLYTQMVGRGTRLNEGKRNLLLLDFLWLSQKHDLCRPACLLSGDLEVQEIITEKTEKDPKCVLELDSDQLEKACEENIVKRENALADILEQQRRKKAKLVDPIQYAYSIQDINLAKYDPVTKQDSSKPTMEQVKRLEKLGFGSPDTFGAAKTLIETYEKRAAEGMSTPKQIRFLERQGFRNVGKWTSVQAKKMITRYTVNGWRTPRGVIPSEYKPA